MILGFSTHRKLPRVHCVIAAGGLAPDHASWVSSRRTFFLPVKVLGRVFRGKFLAGLKAAFREGKLEFRGHYASLSEPCRFAAWITVLLPHDLVNYSKRTFGGPEHALRYLGAFTHRVSIANSRLVCFAEGQVSFRWRDFAHNNRMRVMSLPADEFLRRFLMHLLPRGFVRIRNFGLLANRQRAMLLPICFDCLVARPIGTELKTPATNPSRPSPFPGARSAAEPCASLSGSLQFNCFLARHPQQQRAAA